MRPPMAVTPLGPSVLRSACPKPCQRATAPTRLTLLLRPKFHPLDWSVIIVHVNRTWYSRQCYPLPMPGVSGLREGPGSASLQPSPSPLLAVATLKLCQLIYPLTLCSGTSAAGFGSLCGRFWHPLHPVHPDGHVTYPSLFVTCV
jgi:hypothetical protein